MNKFFQRASLLHVAQSHLILKDGPFFGSQLLKLGTVACIVVTDGAHKYCNIICRISAGLNRFMIYAKLDSRELNNCWLQLFSASMCIHSNFTLVTRVTKLVNAED